MINQTYVILVDDNEDDRELIKQALPEKHVETLKEFISAESFKNDFLSSFTGGLHKGSVFPNLLFLDLRMEHEKSGIEILKEIKASQYLKLIPVIIISSSEKDDDIMDSFENGANLYIVKGDDPEVFVNAIKEIFNSINVSGRLPSDVPSSVILNAK